MESHELLKLACTASAIYAFYAVLGFVYHPLRKFPGPTLAALTRWYGFYYEVLKDGAVPGQLKVLHRKYGPVVRIGPNELHFSDPRAYAAIYATGSKFTKEPIHYATFGEDESSFGYVDPRQAKTRKDLMSPLFSRRAIIKLEGVIQDKVSKLVSRLISHGAYGQAVNLTMAFRSTTLDVITSYSFAQCSDALDAKDFRHPLLVAMTDSLPAFWIFKWIPFFRRLMLQFPWFFSSLDQKLGALVDLHISLKTQIDEILADPSSLDRADHEIIYHRLLSPPPGTSIPPKKSLLEEAKVMIFAGSDTVGNTCTIGTFHVLNNNKVRSKLEQELEDAWPDLEISLSLESLEKLPYLTAVIKESLRMAYGVVGVMPRIVGPSNAEIAGHRIPAGTVVSMGCTFMHTNEEIFPEPSKFDPERWLQPNSKDLETYLVPFSRGPRSCLGINLAWCELYLIFGNIFRKLDMQIYETNLEDFQFKDYFLPWYTGRDFRAKLKGRL